ncbi:MAG: hypothetical protein ACYDD4_11170 [Acidimicrobiales bacterium]
MEPVKITAQRTFGNFVRALMHPQLRRTCKECGGHWVVPRYFSRSHARRNPVAARGGSVSARARVLSFQSANQTADARSRDEDIWRNFRTCPHCGAERKYSQTRMWYVDSKLNATD